MKKKLVFILAIVLLTGCRKDSITARDQDSWHQPDQTLVASMIYGYDKDPAELRTLIEENIDYLSQEDLNKAFFALETSQRNGLARYRDSLEEYRIINSLSGLIHSDQVFKREELHSISDDYARQTIRDILDAGYRIVKKTDLIDLEIDYEGYQEYEEYLNPDLKSYLEISSLARDLDSKDYRKLGQSLVIFEEKIKMLENPLYLDRLLRIYEENLIIFLGDRYTERILDDKGMYSKDIVNIYTEFSRGKSISSQVTKTYLNYISENEYLFKESNRAKILELYTFATSELENQCGL